MTRRVQHIPFHIAKCNRIPSFNEGSRFGRRFQFYTKHGCLGLSSLKQNTFRGMDFDTDIKVLT